LLASHLSHLLTRSHRHNPPWPLRVTKTRGWPCCRSCPDAISSHPSEIEKKGTNTPLPSSLHILTRYNVENYEGATSATTRSKTLPFLTCLVPHRNTPRQPALLRLRLPTFHLTRHNNNNLRPKPRYSSSAACYKARTVRLFSFRLVAVATSTSSQLIRASAPKTRLRPCFRVPKPTFGSALRLAAVRTQYIA